MGDISTDVRDVDLRISGLSDTLSHVVRALSSDVAKHVLPTDDKY